LPGFFLVGAAKSGTTALYRYLEQHPEIFMSPVKEPNFFADEFRLENFTPHFQKMAAKQPQPGPIENWDDYQKLFQGARNESAIGEASVSYLWSESAPRNIAARFPEAKILMVLRNPIERAFSQYAHMLSFADAPISFREYLDDAIGSTSTRIGELYPFLNFGLYYEQVRRYLGLFDPKRIQIHFYEDFTRSPDATLRRIFQFLDVNPDFKPDFSNRHMEATVPRSFFVKNMLKRIGLWEKARGQLPSALRGSLRKAAYRPRNSLMLSPDDRRFLIAWYRDDVLNLSVLLNRDLSSWLSEHESER
jgi:hypothetical protein